MKIGIAAITPEIDPTLADASGSDVSAVDGGALTESSYSDSAGVSGSIRFYPTESHNKSSSYSPAGG